jgi:hypothetical protein
LWVFKKAPGPGSATLLISNLQEVCPFLSKFKHSQGLFLCQVIDDAAVGTNFSRPLPESSISLFCLPFEHQKRLTLHSLDVLRALFSTMLSLKKYSSKAFPFKCGANSAAIVVLFSLLYFQATSN